AENLRLVRAATHLPIIRKDFIFDRYQLWEARAWGADAILLIVAGIAKNALSELHHEASNAGLDVLVEVHNEVEAEIALELGADLVGINNRNLATFETDLDVTDRLMPMFDDQVVTVSESALTSLSDVKRVHQAGARAVLIGTAFCQSPNIVEKVREVMGW
ncbi:MAG: indole-3-glycerol phosphate synthase TrpC, partial [Fimbriimonadaceae bacterium]